MRRPIAASPMWSSSASPDRAVRQPDSPQFSFEVGARPVGALPENGADPSA